jgi:hypothetical protein
MADYHRLIAECLVVSVTRRVLLRAESAGPSLYTVQSNFAFKLFEFFSVSNYPRPKSTMTLAFNFSGLLVLFFSFFSSVSSDYGMFGQVLILIFLIWFFCQVDWNPAFVRSR